MSNSALNNRLTVLAFEITDAVAGVHRDSQSMAEHAIRAGRALVEAKAALPHGAWENWLHKHVQMSPRSARRYMRLADFGMETATVADLGIRAASSALAAGHRGRTKSGSHSSAEDLVEFLEKNLPPVQFERLAAWAERAGIEHPDDTVGRAMAGGVSLARLNRAWAEAAEPARRRFIAWLRDNKDGVANG